MTPVTICRHTVGDIRAARRTARIHSCCSRSVTVAVDNVDSRVHVNGEQDVVYPPEFSLHRVEAVLNSRTFLHG